MTSPRQRPWHHSARQQTVLEYAGLKQRCPEGIYLSLKPGNPLQWSGVLFVRKGPYAPAILRFQITFPYDYPDLPPTITFITDIFHPLVTPLTTYTYTTGSLSSDTVSATDEERLPPGSFSLRHGFPHWFGRAHKSLGSSATSSRDVSGSYTINSHIKEAPIALPAAVGPSHEISARLLIPLQGSGCIKQQKQCSNLSIINRVLEYMKYSFDDEMFLDRVPISAAGNAGAWRAWRAHRANSGVVVEDRVAGEWSPDDGDDWKWDGVWEQRVRRGVDTSTSDSVLFGGTGGGDDLIRFADLDDALVRGVKARTIEP